LDYPFIEAFVGQELLVYSDPIMKEELFYWHKEVRGSQAEVDYLIQLKDQVVPIEVKVGHSNRLKSMPIFFRDAYAVIIWFAIFCP
jgi:predicted AAA+ superfamily ATPase